MTLAATAEYNCAAQSGMQSDGLLCFAEMRTWERQGKSVSVSLSVTPQLTGGQDVTLKSLWSLSYVTLICYLWPACSCSFDLLVAGLVESVDSACESFFHLRIYAPEQRHLERRVALLSVSFRCLFFSSSVCFRGALGLNSAHFYSLNVPAEAVTSPAAVMLHHKRDHRFVWQYWIQLMAFRAVVYLTWSRCSITERWHKGQVALQRGDALRVHLCWGRTASFVNDKVEGFVTLSQCSMKSSTSERSFFYHCWTWFHWSLYFLLMFICISGEYE